MHQLSKAWIHGVVEDSPIVNDEARASSVPLTITKTWVAVAVALVVPQPHPPPDLATKRNSKVRVKVRPGALPKLGGSVMVTVKFPPPGQGTTRLSQGPKVGLPGLPTVIISVQTPDGWVGWAGKLTFSHHSHVQSEHPPDPAAKLKFITKSKACPL